MVDAVKPILLGAANGLDVAKLKMHLVRVEMRHDQCVWVKGTDAFTFTQSLQTDASTGPGFRPSFALISEAFGSGVGETLVTITSVDSGSIEFRLNPLRHGGTWMTSDWTYNATIVIFGSCP